MLREIPEDVRDRWLGLLTNTLISRLLGTRAKLEVTTPSSALSVATTGLRLALRPQVRKPRGPEGTTVALSTYAGAPGAQDPAIAASRCPLNGNAPAGLRVSSARTASPGKTIAHPPL